MKVIRYIKSTGKKLMVEYPGIWPNELVGLDSDIEIYEIVNMSVPTFDPNKYLLQAQWNLTDKKGELYNICEIGYELIEKTKDEVLMNFNKTFGDFIDSNYPLWERLKDISYPTDDGAIRKQQEANLRELRELRENDYLNNNIFPDFNFEWL